MSPLAFSLCLMLDSDLTFAGFVTVTKPDMDHFSALVLEQQDKRIGRAGFDFAF